MPLRGRPATAGVPGIARDGARPQLSTEHDPGAALRGHGVAHREVPEDTAQLWERVRAVGGQHEDRVELDRVLVAVPVMLVEVTDELRASPGAEAPSRSMELRELPRVSLEPAKVPAVRDPRTGAQRGEHDRAHHVVDVVLGHPGPDAAVAQSREGLGDR